MRIIPVLLYLLISCPFLANASSYELHTQRKIIQRNLLPQEGIIYEESQIHQAYLYSDFFLRVEGRPVEGLLDFYSFVHPDITMLFLRNCGVLNGSDIKAFSVFNNLKYLKLVDMVLTDEMFKDLVDELPNSLICLEIRNGDLTKEGLMYMINSGKFNYLARLYIWNDAKPSAFTRTFFDDLAQSAIKTTLEKINITPYDTEWYELCKSTQNFLLDYYVEPIDFYEKNGDEVYILDDPIEFGFQWEVEKDHWILQQLDPAYDISCSSQNSGSTSEGLELLKRVREGLWEAAKNGKVVIEYDLVKESSEENSEVGIMNDVSRSSEKTGVAFEQLRASFSRKFLARPVSRERLQSSLEYIMIFERGSGNSVDSLNTPDSRRSLNGEDSMDSWRNMDAEESIDSEQSTDKLYEGIL
jgi:hypothetical protein